MNLLFFKLICLFVSRRGQPHWFLFMNQHLCQTLDKTKSSFFFFFLPLFFKLFFPPLIYILSFFLYVFFFFLSKIASFSLIAPLLLLFFFFLCLAMISFCSEFSLSKNCRIGCLGWVKRRRGVEGLGQGVIEFQLRGCACVPPWPPPGYKGHWNRLEGVDGQLQWRVVWRGVCVCVSIPPFRYPVVFWATRGPVAGSGCSSFGFFCSVIWDSRRDARGVNSAIQVLTLTRYPHTHPPNKFHKIIIYYKTKNILDCNTW